MTLIKQISMRILVGIAAVISLLFLSCSQKNKVDLLVYNGIIYTVDSGFTISEAMAVKDGKIVATGTTDEIMRRFDAPTKTDLSGKAVYPGFIDAHCHFFAYGCDLIK